MIVGLVAVYSASFVLGLARFGDPQYYIVRQAAWAVVGLALLLAAARTDYDLLRRYALPLMVLTIAGLMAVLVIGVEGGGARRWIGFGEITLQPAEFAKLTVTIYLAAWLAAKGDSIRSFESGFVPFVIILGLVAALIMLEPSLGTTFIILCIAVTMFYVAGASMVQMAALAISGTLALLVLATVEGYRLERILTFLKPEVDPQGHGFQTRQALIALGNGGIDGLGLGASRAKFFYIPESHTDGIFAIVGEEMGIIAAAAVLLLYVVLMVRGFQVARRCEDEFGMLVATGITTWFTVQAIVNIGGITSVLPLTGVPLPFLSYGSNALVANMLAMGVLICISRFGSRPEPGRRRSIVRRSRR